MPLACEAESSAAPHRRRAAQDGSGVSCAGKAHTQRQRRRQRGGQTTLAGAAAGAILLTATSAPTTQAAPVPAQAHVRQHTQRAHNQVHALMPRSPAAIPRRASLRSARETVPEADADDVDLLAENLQHLEDIWKSDRFETPVDVHSHEDDQQSHTSTPPALASDSSAALRKGKGRAREPTSPYVYNLEALHDVPLRKAERGHSTMRLTSQRSPFHTSEVGRLASQSPNPRSVGLFRPDYPFVPSGRRRPKASLFNSTNKAGVFDYRKGAAQHGSLYTLPPDVTEGNVFKHGWTSAMLDDDARLSVPDELRRPRQESALVTAKKLVGLPWYRWKVGEGYVMSTRKDYSAYKNGPGIALGQLLPPRQHPYTSSLPLIPNDAKRDLAWMIFYFIFIFAVLALFREMRRWLRTARKGKSRQLNIPLIRILHDERASSSSADFGTGSIGLRTRQRSKARSIREMCKAALESPLQRMRGASHAKKDARRFDLTRSGSERDRQHRRTASDEKPKRPSLLSRTSSLLGRAASSSKVDILPSSSVSYPETTPRKKKRDSGESKVDEIGVGLMEGGIVTHGSPSRRAPARSTYRSNSPGSPHDDDQFQPRMMFAYVPANDGWSGAPHIQSRGEPNFAVSRVSTGSEASTGSREGSSSNTSTDVFLHSDSGCSIAVGGLKASGHGRF